LRTGAHEDRLVAARSDAAIIPDYWRSNGIARTHFLAWDALFPSVDFSSSAVR
jgi:hypothetical protein